jgi:hypothetical protein
LQNTIYYEMQRRELFFGDYTLDLKKDQPRGGSSQIKTPTIVEDHQETANTHNSHLI